MAGFHEKQRDVPIVCEEVAGSWQFLHRVGQMSLVEHAVSSTAESYRRVKEASPKMMQPAIESVEATTVKILERIITTIQALPMPLKYADKIARNGLDSFLEQLTEYKYWILGRLRAFLSKDESVSTDEECFSKLIEFANKTKNTAVGDIRNSLEAFLNTQIGLFERIEEAVESFYRIHKESNASASEALPSLMNGKADPSNDLSIEVFKIRLTFDEVLEQRNLRAWHGRRPNPLEPLWTYLQSLVEALPAEELMVRRFSEKIFFIKIVLQNTAEQMKLATADPSSFSLEEVKNTMIDQLTGLALAWLPDFALNGLSRITGSQLSDGVSPLSTSDCEEPGAETSTPKNDDSPSVAPAPAAEGEAAQPVTINVHFGTPPENLPQATVSEAETMHGESNGLLGVAEDEDADAGDSSDQNSLSGFEHSSEVETCEGEERRRTSRSTWRRKKTSIDCAEHFGLNKKLLIYRPTTRGETYYNEDCHPKNS